MKIWVDADACPSPIKEILFRAAERVKVLITLVSNQPLRTPSSPYIQSIQVAEGFDIADHHIVQMVQSGDLVITADIPLAAEVVAKDAHALDPRGELYSAKNIGERLAMRNLIGDLRDRGMVTGGPASFSKNDRQTFANQLDRLLARIGNEGQGE